MSPNWIEKIGLAALDGDRLLVVRKHGGTLFILPGGKPEGSEGDLAALTRELGEELGCGLAEPRLVGVFTDQAAGSTGKTVIVRLYAGELTGTPTPQAEIEELAWVNIRKPHSLPLAPSIVNKILPHLRSRRFSRQSGPLQADTVQGSFESL